MTKYTYLIFFAMLLYLSALGQAVPSLEDLVTDSDLVVVGRIIDVEISGATAEIYVDPARVLKGKMDTQTLRARAKMRPSGLAASHREDLRNRKVILFMVSNEEVEVPMIMLDNIGSLEQALITSPVGREEPRPETSPINTLQEAMKEIAEMYARNPTPAALELLMPLAWRRTEPLTLKKIFEDFLESDDPRVVGVGKNGMAILGEPGSIYKLDEELDLLSDEEADRRLELIERFYRADDNLALDMLLSWLQSGRLVVRARSAGILARLRNVRAVTALGKALYDPDFEVRWRAVGGLSIFVNNINLTNGVPEDEKWRLRSEETMKHSVFDRNVMSKDENYYLEFWRGWWADHGEQIYSAAGSH